MKNLVKILETLRNFDSLIAKVNCTSCKSSLMMAKAFYMTSIYDDLVEMKLENEVGKCNY